MTSGDSRVEPASAVTDLSELFAAERESMLRLATLIVGSSSRAEEIVQEAFATVGQRWETLSNPGGYLRACVVNGSRSSLRRRASEARALELVARRPADQPRASLIELAQAIDKLNDRQRLVVVLRYFVDVPDAEIASLLEIRPATVRSVARRAFAVLRKELS